MSTDDDLDRLLHDAVSRIEPADRLGELRARTTTTRGTGLRWGAALTAAALVAIVAGVAATTGPDAARDPVATGPTQTPSQTPTQTPTAGTGRAVAAYFVGETPTGPRLYREFQRVEQPDSSLPGLALLESGPTDPDYTSLWPATSFGEVRELSDGVLEVTLLTQPDGPEDLALQQVVYTLRAGLQEPGLSVSFRRGDELIDPVAAAPQLDVLALVNLSDPVEGQELVDDRLTVRGVASSNEANVPWRIEGTDLSGSFTAEGWMGTRLFPFSGDVDVSSLDPGTYTLIVETDDPSGGAEGPGATSDSRTVVVP